MKFAVFAVPVALALSACGGSEVANPVASAPAIPATPTTPTRPTTPTAPAPTPVSAIGLPATNFTKAELKAMSATSTMPTGNASYAGKFEANGIKVSSGIVFDTKYESDFNLAANFDNKTVSSTLSNNKLTIVQQIAGNTGIATYQGNVTGNGTISGSTISLGTLSGQLTPTSFTLNGAPTALLQGGTLVVSNVMGANFVGENASGIYQKGLGFVDGSFLSTEFYANRQ